MLSILRKFIGNLTQPDLMFKIVGRDGYWVTSDVGYSHCVMAQIKQSRLGFWKRTGRYLELTEYEVAVMIATDQIKKCYSN